MSAHKREGNRPDRRIAAATFLSDNLKAELLARIRYVGSPLHKLHSGDYGFVPPQNPRPSKSPCDELRPLLLNEAQELFRRGIELGMVSKFAAGSSVPKYVWALSADGDVYEAKTKPGQETEYHGYRLGDDEVAMRKYVAKEWKSRCQ